MIRLGFLVRRPVFWTKILIVLAGKLSFIEHFVSSWKRTFFPIRCGFPLRKPVVFIKTLIVLARKTQFY